MPRKRGLSAEDRDLWSRVARSATPLHPAKRQPAPQPAKPSPGKTQDLPQPQPFLPQPFRLGEASAPALSRIDSRSPSPAERLGQNPLRMDHKTHRKMRQGKLRPEARLDLHGMTLAQAHPELIHFVLSAHSAGLRLVLVITGKGRGDHGPLPTRPGALRHQLPVWLHQPPLAAIVQQSSAAHFRHGGEGAYYLYLRR